MAIEVRRLTSADLDQMRLLSEVFGQAFGEVFDGADRLNNSASCPPEPGCARPAGSSHTLAT